MTKQDAYQLVTDRIVAALDKGFVPWHRPWRAVGGGPMSLSTLKPYKGVNVWVLEATSMLAGYSSPWWGTYKQISERGGQVRKGEKGTPVVFFKVIVKHDEAGEETARIPLLKHFMVFNAEQCDNLSTPVIEPLPERDPIESAENIAAGYLYAGPKLSHGGDRACYSPSLDAVRMPVMGAFDSSEHYYGTLFHELAHSTGHSSRLKRPSLVEPTPFGTPDYSREELVAELAAAFVCGEAGIPVNVQHHTGYIASWLRALKDDRKLIVWAAGQASKAAALIIGEEGDAESSASPSEPVATPA